MRTARKNAAQEAQPGLAPRRRETRVPPRTADHATHRRDRRTPQAKPGGHRCRRDRVGEDHAIAQGLPCGGPRRARRHRPYAAPTPCGANGGVADRQRTRRGLRRGGGLRRAVHRPNVRADRGQGGDRRSAAQRDPARPGAQALLVRDRRRGPRTQPQRRLHPRLPETRPRAAARSEGDRHECDDRCGSLRGLFRRCAGRGGIRARLSGRDRLRAAGEPSAGGARGGTPRKERALSRGARGGAPRKERALSRGPRGGTPRKKRALSRGARGGTPRKQRAPSQGSSIAWSASARTCRPDAETSWCSSPENARSSRTRSS